MSIGAETMAALRMQAQALAFHWLVARDFEAEPQGQAWFLLRPEDFWARASAMNGLRIRVSLNFEPDLSRSEEVASIEARNQEREEVAQVCIDIVARNGGSVEIEAEIRRRFIEDPAASLPP